MSDQIFISYRRDDAAYVTGHINDRLRKEFGNDSIFTDVDKIALGVDFRTTLDLMVSQCQILLAVIGHDWLTVKNKDGTVRLQDPADFVRIEIESALQRDIPVIPLLVAGTKMPSKDELPESLQELAFRNGTQIRPEPDFHTDLDRLIKSLKSHLELDADGADPDVNVEDAEQSRKQIELPMKHPKRGMPALVLWPLIMIGISLVAGASWYAYVQYQEQVEATNTALAAVQKTAADAAAKREADAIAEAKRQADADAERQTNVHVEAGRQADAEAQRLADAEANRLVVAKLQTDAEAQLEADAEDQAKRNADAEAQAQREADASAEAERQANASAALNRGLSTAARGDHVAAIENYSEAIELGAEPAFIYKQRGASHYALGDYEAAIKDYDEAIRLNAENANAFYNRSRAHYTLQDFAAAENDCNEAIQLGPDYADAYYDNGCRFRN